MQTELTVFCNDLSLTFQQVTTETLEDAVVICRNKAVNPGIELTAENIASVSLTLICENKTDTEINTGSWYVIEAFDGQYWKPLNYLRNDADWTDIAYIIDDRREFELEWEWLYGKLTEGEYRIGKSFGKADTVVYTYFEIEGE